MEEGKYGRYGFRYKEPKLLNNYQETLPLPKDLFWLEVPQIATYSSYELENIGMPAEGYLDKLHNPNVNKRTLVRWDLDTILDCYRNGYSISFTDKNDIVRLVDLIDDYFDKVNKAINSKDRDMYAYDERLEDLDRLASSIYSNNKGRILIDRQDVIKQVSLQSMFPDMVLKELNIQPHSVTKTVRDYGSKVYGRYGSRTDDEIKDNPLELVQSQLPQVDLSVTNYNSRYIDPKERRIADEYEKARRK